MSYNSFQVIINDLESDEFSFHSPLKKGKLEGDEKWRSVKYSEVKVKGTGKVVPVLNLSTKQ
jgi:hypothetical protein